MRRALGIATAVVLTIPTAVLAAAQETPTERSAAADVIRRMNELERSLALPQLVARLTGRDARRDAVVARARALMDQELLAMADDITRHPEVGHKEERSVKILTDYLDRKSTRLNSSHSQISYAVFCLKKKKKKKKNYNIYKYKKHTDTQNKKRVLST